MKNRKICCEVTSKIFFVTDSSVIFLKLCGGDLNYSKKLPFIQFSSRVLAVVRWCREHGLALFSFGFSTFIRVTFNKQRTKKKYLYDSNVSIGNPPIYVTDRRSYAKTRFHAFFTMFTACATDCNNRPEIELIFKTTPAFVQLDALTRVTQFFLYTFSAT